jgi:hypothetical protein
MGFISDLAIKPELPIPKTNTTVPFRRSYPAIGQSAR